MRGSQGAVVAGDVITAVGDEPLSDPDSLLGALERYQPGDKVTLSLWRDGKTRRQEVTLAASDE
jgi:S1-C subfamily serine protease